MVCSHLNPPGRCKEKKTQNGECITRKLRRKPSDPYTKFASYYDAIYNQIVDYETQTTYIEKILDNFSKRKIESILDVACGTGNHTFIFAKRGYQATGIDLSSDMIAVAKGKLQTSKERAVNLPEFYEMDMRDIRFQRDESGKKFDAAIVMFGGFGYLLESEDVIRFFNSAKRNLEKEGLLLLEFWQTTGVHSQASTKPGYLSWVRAEDGDRVIIRLDTNKYDAQSSTSQVLFDFYVLDKEKRQLIDSFSETHVLKPYSISGMRNLLERSGFDVLGFYKASATSAGEIQNAELTDFRVLAVARNNQES